jgi:hypothetical protein
VERERERREERETVLSCTYSHSYISLLLSQVLKSFDIPHPCSAIELNLEMFM